MRRMRACARLLLLLVLPPAGVAAQQPARAPARARGAAAADTGFARLVERLSEPGGFFDSDNLISNEASYLHVLGKMRQMGVSGGAYIGVGPDQNFSYMAQVRPRVAFIVDIRRDNLLQHLLFKALFELSRNRAEYLCLLTGRPVPADLRRWDARPVQELVTYVDGAPGQRALFDAAAARVAARARGYGLALSDTDVATIRRIHEQFFANGLDLQFTSMGRGSRPYYPTLRQLLLETDLTGRQANYLAREDDFQFLKALEERNLVIPVVGNLAGDHALAAVGREIARRGERVSAFYTSNVEFYLLREGSFDRFAAAVRQLPRDPRSVIIRSYFGGMSREPHPLTVAGYYSTQLLQTMDSFAAEVAAGGYQSYYDLVTKHALDLR